MFCIKCGSPNDDSSSFCVRCGTRLPVTPNRAPVTPQAQWTPEANEPTVFASQAENPVVSPQGEPVWQEEDMTQVPEAPAARSAGPDFSVEAPQYQAPVAAQYQAFGEAQTPTEDGGTPRKSRPAPTAGKKVLTAVLCLFFALFFLYAGTVGILRNLLNEESYNDILEDTDFNKIILTVDGKEYELAEYIWEAIPSQLTRAFSRRNIEDILDSEKVKKAVAAALADYTDYLIADEPLHPLTSEDVAEFFDNNRKLASGIYDSYGISHGSEYLTSLLESSFEFDNVRSVSRLERFLDTDFGLAKFLLSPLGYGIAIFLCVLMLALILLVNRANIPACLTAVFVTGITLGSLYLLAALALCGTVLFVSATVVELLSALLLRVAVLLALRGSIALAVGLIGILIGRARKKRQAAKA